MSIEELIHGCKRQDRRVQKALFLKYKDLLYNISLKYCRNASEAEDNVHDAFITVFEKINTYKGEGSFEGWMKRITIFKAIDKFKDAIRFNSEVKETAEEDTSIPEEHKPDLAEILHLLQELPDQYRLVFSLYELDDHSHKEISELLGISEGTSKSNLHRAKAILKERILALKVKSHKTMN